MDRVGTGSDAPELSSVLDAIYDASLDPARWSRALECAGLYLNCGRGVIGLIDAKRLDSDIVFSWGFEPGYLARLSEAAKQNGALGRSLERGICEVVSGRDLVDLEAYAASESYRQWAGPQGIIDVIQTILERTATSVVIAGFSRLASQGPIDDVTHQRMALLAPHFRRAFLIGKTIDLKRLEVEMLLGTMDGLAAAVFLVDGQLRLVHANASGERLLDRRVLQVRDGFLRVPDAKVHGMLAQSVAAALDARLSADGATLLLGRPQGRRFAAHVLPLGSGLRRPAAHGATAAIFVRDTAIEFPGPVRAVGACYGLTAAEMRVFLLVVDMRGVTAVAEALGVSEATVRTHLRSIFRKTGTSAQAELVKLAAGFQSPVAGR